MKLVINNTGNIEEVENKLALRMINKGTAHPVKEQKGGIVDINKMPKLNNDLILNSVQTEKLKEIIPKKSKRSRRKKPKLISDSVDFEDHIKGFEEKKKSKFRSWND